MSKETVLDSIYDLSQERKHVQTLLETGEMSREVFEDWLADWQKRCERARVAKYANEPVKIPIKEIPPEKDMIDMPSHYADRKFEVWDVMEDTMTREQFIGYNLGATIKYLMRWDKKGYPLQDLKKARNYLNKLISVISEEST